LSWAEFCYNFSYQTAIKCSPFQVVYGWKLTTLLSYQQGTAHVAVVDQQLMERDEFLGEIRERLLQAQVTMKQHQDRTRREVVFSDGAWVWLKLQQRTAVGVTATASSKLGPKYFGPYKCCNALVKSHTSSSYHRVPGFMTCSTSLY
jgi:hypothetical protein